MGCDQHRLLHLVLLAPDVGQRARDQQDQRPCPKSRGVACTRHAPAGVSTVMTCARSHCRTGSAARGRSTRRERCAAAHRESRSPVRAAATVSRASSAACAGARLLGQLVLEEVRERCRSACRARDRRGADRCVPAPRTLGAEQRQHDEQRARVYHRVSRAEATALSSAAVHHELVAFAAARADQRLGARPIELAPQPLDVDVDDVRQRIVVFVPDVLGDVARG